MGGWYLSEDGETFSVGPYPSKERAIEVAPDELEDVEPGDAFWVGRAVSPPNYLTAWNVIEMLDQQASDTAPEDFEGFEVSDEARRELDALLSSWAERWKVKPSWLDIAEISEHEMPERA
jgi:hypothetical protein